MEKDIENNVQDNDKKVASTSDTDNKTVENNDSILDSEPSIKSEKLEESPKITKKSEKKKKVSSDKPKRKPFILRFFKGIFVFIFIILLVLIGWFAYCSFSKQSNLNALPTDYSVYVRTDSVWEAVEPILDLKAADIFLANDTLVKFRETFLTLRESNFRDNFFVSYALSRRIDAALYENESFIAIADMGLLSGITRLAPVAYRFFSIPNLIYAMSGNNSCFEYTLENMILYIKVSKNLVIVTNDKALLQKSISFDNEASYTKEELKLLKQPLDQPFRIAADGKKLISLLEEENQYIKAITNTLSTKELSEIKFGITDNDINISIKIPFEISENLSDNAIVKLLQKDSQVPVLLTKLPESVQYYTFITAGNLSELKDTAFTVFSDKPDLQKKWQDANGISKLVFKETLDEILFSWTADEYAILGIEGKAEPVFAIKIADEVKRQYVFDTILSSIVFKADNSLLLDGIRMPRIEFPAFLQGLLEAFKINLPRPYYMVKDGFVYFSQSPENLASINAAIKSGVKLSNNENWQLVSKKQNAQTSLSLFYDLERSIPFFIKKKSLVSDILQLYNIGRVDVMTQNNTIYLTLQAIACETTSTQYIPGFPITSDSKVTPVLHKSNVEKSKMLYWQENDSVVKALNAATLNISQKEINNLYWITETSPSKDDNELWAVTKEGNVYLLNSKLENTNGFPVITGENPTSTPAVYKNKIIFFAEDGKLISVSTNGEKSVTQIDVLNDIKSEPTIYQDFIAVYEKGFIGTIHLLTEENNEFIEKSLLDVDGIAFGSPVICTINNQTYTAFITQAGLLYVWDSENNLLDNFPLQLDGIFYTNVKSADNYLVALSSDGTVFKVDLNCNITKVQIPYLSARNGYITINDYDNDGISEIFICGDANTIYGFNSDLEYLNRFPVSGFGIPVFTDVNGDKLSDCITLSIDNKLNAWKVR